VRWTSSSIAVGALLLLAPTAAAQTPPLPPGQIAQVSGVPILQTDFDHWREVAIRSAGGEQPEQQTRDQVMQLLISFQWIELEAKRRGITVPSGAVYTSYKRQRDQAFPHDEDFERFLEKSGQTVADIKLRVRLDLLSTRIRDHVVRRAKTPRGQQRLLNRFVKRFTRHYKAQTICGEPYATSECGSTAPLSV